MSRSFSDVIRFASPPAVGRTQMFIRVSHGARYDRVFPSGDSKYPRLSGFLKKSRSGTFGGGVEEVSAEGEESSPLRIQEVATQRRRGRRVFMAGICKMRLVLRLDST